jgi:hypothetical protein
MKTCTRQMYTVEDLAEFYQKLKGSIFLKLSHGYGPHDRGDGNIQIWEAEKDYPTLTILEKELTFEEFVARCRYEF